MLSVKILFSFVKKLNLQNVMLFMSFSSFCIAP